jgi:hypothetical protein
MAKIKQKDLVLLREELQRELELSKQNRDLLRPFIEEGGDPKTRFEIYRGQAEGLNVALKKLESLI